MIRSGYPELYEYTRTALLDKARKETKQRYAKRTESGENWSLERVGLLELVSGSEDLYLYFSVNGKYKVALVILKFKPVLDKYLEGKFKNDPNKAIDKALMYALKYNHVKTSCECNDFKYRMAYMATKKGYGFEVEEERPATKTNPNNQGGLCKHQIKILMTPSKWKAKVISGLKNYTKKYN